MSSAWGRVPTREMDSDFLSMLLKFSSVLVLPNLHLSELFTLSILIRPIFYPSFS